MKKIILTLLTSSICLSLFAAESEPVNQKVLTVFNKTFAHAVDVLWSEFLGYYEVDFTQNDIKTKITYTEDGSIVRTIRYYNGDRLPLLVLTKVKNSYSDKKIFGVVEESSEGGALYHITLEDEKKWTIIKADDFGTITTENKFIKG